MGRATSFHCRGPRGWPERESLLPHECEWDSISATTPPLHSLTNQGDPPLRACVPIGPPRTRYKSPAQVFQHSVLALASLWTCTFTSLPKPSRSSRSTHINPSSFLVYFNIFLYSSRHGYQNLRSYRSLLIKPTCVIFLDSSIHFFDLSKSQFFCESFISNHQNDHGCENFGPHRSLLMISALLGRRLVTFRKKRKKKWTDRVSTAESSPVAADLMYLAMSRILRPFWWRRRRRQRAASSTPRDPYFPPTKIIFLIYLLFLLIILYYIYYI